MLVDGAAESFAQHVPSRGLEQLLAAVRIGGGDFLPDHSGEWAKSCRHDVNQMIADAAARAGELLVAKGDFDQGAGLAETAMHKVPTHLAAWRLRIDTHVRAGNRSGAQRAATDCQNMLRDHRLDPDPRPSRLCFAPPNPSPPKRRARLDARSSDGPA